MVLLFVLAFLFLLLLPAAISEAKSVCYDGVGCFSDEPPFDGLPLPMSPEKVAPTWYLFKHGQHGAFRIVTSSEDVSMEDVIVIVHGLLGSFDKTRGFTQPIVDALLAVRPAADVLFVDWRAGAALGGPFRVYKQPASNTRVVGRLIARFLHDNPGFNASRTYCIGFSLGAHVCSFFAKWVSSDRLGRITGLDPAGPLFEKADYPDARLDKSDADFVDVIHTSRLGLDIAVGHVDFWVNDPSTTQPGCYNWNRDDESSPAAGSFGELVTCSHHRATYVFAATIVPTCSYDFCPCQSKQLFLEGGCNACDLSAAQQLGYRSVFNKNRGNFYGKTGAEAPYYCKTKGANSFNKLSTHA